MKEPPTKKEKKEKKERKQKENRKAKVSYHSLPSSFLRLTSPRSKQSIQLAPSTPAPAPAKSVPKPNASNPEKPFSLPPPSKQAQKGKTKAVESAEAPVAAAGAVTEKAAKSKKAAVRLSSFSLPCIPPPSADQSSSHRLPTPLPPPGPSLPLLLLPPRSPAPLLQPPPNLPRAKRQRRRRRRRRRRLLGKLRRRWRSRRRWRLMEREGRKSRVRKRARRRRRRRRSKCRLNRLSRKPRRRRKSTKYAPLSLSSVRFLDGKPSLTFKLFSSIAARFSARHCYARSQGEDEEGEERQEGEGESPDYSR